MKRALTGPRIRRTTEKAGCLGEGAGSGANNGWGRLDRRRGGAIGACDLEEVSGDRPRTGKEESLGNPWFGNLPWVEGDLRKGKNSGYKKRTGEVTGEVKQSPAGVEAQNEKVK